jgi:probable HAF family extracellular repeat protein
MAALSLSLLPSGCGGGASNVTAPSVQMPQSAPAGATQAAPPASYARGYTLAAVGWYSYNAGHTTTPLIAQVQNTLNDAGQLAGYVTVETCATCADTAATNGTPSFSVTNDYCTGHNGRLACFSTDTASNNAGLTVGNQLMGYPAFDPYSGVQTFHAFSGAIDLGTLGGPSSHATGVNNNGQVVGYSDTAGNAGTRAFIFQNATMVSLGTLGGSSSQANAVNDAGQVVGNSTIAGSTTPHAFLYSGGALVDLGAGQANAVNRGGQVAGSNALGAFVTGANGAGIVPLGAGSAVGVNNAGQVVINSTGAFLWDGAVRLDLNSLVAPADPLRAAVTLTSVIAINNHGQILANGHDSSGWQRQYLLTPPPVADQMAALLTLVTGPQIDSALAGKVTQAQAFEAAADLPDTCVMLNSIEGNLTADAGIPAQQVLARQLQVDVHVMMSTIGCTY